MNVDVENLAPFINRLEKFDKDVSKELKAGIKSGANVIVDSARRRIMGNPISNWGRWIDAGVMPKSTDGRDLSFNPTKVRSGIKAVPTRRRKAGVVVAYGIDVMSTNPAGSIYELVGSRGRTPRFTDRFGGGPYPRTLYPAYYEGIGEAMRIIESAVDDAARKVGL